MGDLEQRILFTNQFETKGLAEMNAGFNQLSKNLSNLSSNINKHMNARFKELNANFIKQNKIQKEASKNTEKYRNEMMGLRRSMIAFFFVTREMGRLMSPAAEVVGIFEIWNTILTVTFLPAMLILLQYVMLPMLDFFLSVPEPMQTFVGLLLMGGMAFGALTFAAKLCKTTLGPFMAWVVGAGLIFVGMVDLWNGKLEGFGLVIMGIGVILLLFIGWWALIPIAIGAAIYLGIKYFKELKVYFHTFLAWMLKAIKDIPILGEVFNFSAKIFGTSLDDMIKNQEQASADILKEIEDEKKKEVKATEEAAKKEKDITLNSGIDIKNMSKDLYMGMNLDYKSMLDTKLALNQSNTDAIIADNKRIAAMQETHNETPMDWELYYQGMNYINRTGTDRSGAPVSFAPGYGDYFGGINVDDAIIRPGQPPIKINPNDTLIAGKNPNGGTLGAMGGTSIVQNIYVTASNKDEISRMINQNNKTLVMDIKRMVGS